MMKIFRKFACCLVLTVVVVMTASSAFARNAYTMGSVVVSNVWAGETKGGAKTAAVYFKIANGGGKADVIISAATPVADKAAIHSHRKVGTVMTMRAIPGVAIGPGKRYTLKPGGTHIMLMGLKAPLKEGDKFPMTLFFKSGGKLDIYVTVGSSSRGGKGSAPKTGKTLKDYR